MFSSSRARARGTLDTGRREAATWLPESLEAAPEESELHDPALELAGADDPTAVPDPDEATEQVETVDLQAEIDAAYQRGYDDGRAEGRAVEAARVGNAVRALEEVMASVEEHRPRWFEALEQNLVALATAIAREVIGREVQGNAEDVTGLVRQAIHEFPLTAAIRIRLNPADLTAISSPLGGGALESGRQVRWIPDPDVAPGGCIVEGPESIVDGRVEKALDRIYSELIYGD